MLPYETLIRTAPETDPRTRRTIPPTRILTTRGDVRGERCLFDARPAQATLAGAPACVLRNPDEGERAGVLLDFGIEIHGTVTAVLSGIRAAEPTAQLRIRTGESASEALTPLGVKNTTNDHASRDLLLPVSCYSANETPETGFRFAYVELDTPGCEVHLVSVLATAILRDLEYAGSFDCSDPLLKQCYDTAAYTVHLNLQRYLWDGIKRDRLVWAGDMNTEIHTVLAVFGGGCDAVPRSLDLVRDSTPAGEAMNGIPAYTLWWMLCHYDWYMGTGDLSYLKEQRDYLCAMLPRYLSMIDEAGSETMGGFFDWPSRENEAQMHAGRQGLMGLALRAGEQLLSYLDERDLSARCAEAADRLLLHTPDPMGYKQAAAMLALARPGEASHLVDSVILPGGARGLSSFLGYFTLTAAAESARIPEALSMIRQYWGGMLSLGATSFWEDFDLSWAENAHRIDELPVPGKKDPHGDCGAFCYRNFRHSLCHGWASGPAPFLTKYVLGVRPFAPGMRAVRFAPELGDLSWAAGTVPTPFGVIRVELEKDRSGRTVGRFDKPDEVDVIVR